jgi:selenide, water dikinase
MQSTVPIEKDLVLLGGGHAHVIVLKKFAMAPVEGLRITLINREPDTPYSGMLPGLIAGHYTCDETHIDLGRLARFCGARFVHDEVIGIEPEKNHLLFASRPPLRYDVLSIDTGSTPNMKAVPGAAQYSVPVKPISNFLTRWNALSERALQSTGPLRIAVAGAGAGGVEMTLAAQFRLCSLRKAAGIDAPVTFDLFSGSDGLLPAFNHKAQTIFARVLQERSIILHRGSKVIKVEARSITLENGETFFADEVLFVTDAAAPAWLHEGGLATDPRGFVQVHETLQSVSHANVFAAGDVASVAAHPRPKAGVFAVRQGPPLARNLLHALTGMPLLPYKPQKHFLSLVSTGDRYAVATRYGFTVSGAWIWHLKNWIDRRFMSRFNDLPRMVPGTIRKPAARLPSLDHVASDAMRCGGCGAKVGADVLSQALRDLHPLSHDDIIAGLSAPDDAAIVRAPAGKAMVHTVDTFRAFVEDPYIFGKIAANHALSDIFAMGAEPRTALAIATLPFGAPVITASDLHHMMAGAVDVLNSAGASLVGGHSAEGAELTLGFAINGVIDEARILRKGGLRPGDAIILTKPLGTGALFAADMQYRARSHWIAAALQSMLQSNGPAARILLDANANACTDITGFGLAGHLGELAQASNVSIILQGETLPVLEGAHEVMREGIFSSLHGQNEANALRYFDPTQHSGARRYPVLFDPQTSGGLAAGVAADRAKACVRALREKHCASSVIIGTVAARSSADPHLRLE